MIGTFKQYSQLPAAIQLAISEAGQPRPMHFMAQIDGGLTVRFRGADMDGDWLQLFGVRAVGRDDIEESACFSVRAAAIDWAAVAKPVLN
jgi:hypothetical protein